MNGQGDTDAATLAGIAETVRSHPGLAGKAGLKLVSQALGASDWVSGPGDDTAATWQPPSGRETFMLAAGEAIYPPFLRTDPCSAGMAAVIANVNDAAAMGGRPLGIVDTIIASERIARQILEGMSAAAKAVPACRRAFAARGLACAEIGGIDRSGELALQLVSRRQMALDLSADLVTGLRRGPAPGNERAGPGLG